MGSKPTVRRNVVLPAKLLFWCVMCCRNELFDEAAQERLDAMIDDDALDESVLRPPSFRTLDRMKSGIFGAMRRPVQKRCDWLGRNCTPEVYQRIYIGCLLCEPSIQPDQCYRVSSRWSSSFSNAVSIRQWETETKRESDEPWLRQFAGSPGYIQWIELGGSSDLIRWTAHYFAGGESFEFPLPES